MSFWIGLDWGQKKVGYAVADLQGVVVSPKGMWVRKKITSKQIWTPTDSDFAELSKLLEEFDGCGWVLGSPKNIGGKSTDSSIGAQNLAANLINKFGLPVHLVDESLSTWQAKSRSKELGRGARKIPEDAWAAAGILEDFFEQKKNFKTKT